MRHRNTQETRPILPGETPSCSNPERERVQRLESIVNRLAEATDQELKWIAWTLRDQARSLF